LSFVYQVVANDHRSAASKPKNHKRKSARRKRIIAQPSNGSITELKAQVRYIQIKQHPRIFEKSFRKCHKIPRSSCIFQTYLGTWHFHTHF